VSSPARELDLVELEAGLDFIRNAPRDAGTLEMIVRRPSSGEREELAAARLDPVDGLVGDRWGAALPRGSGQLTLIGSRVIGLIAQDRARWALAGDQLYVDLDLSVGNLPAGTQLEVGDALIEATGEPHAPCAKFRMRYGLDAARFVGSALGKELQLRGIKTRILRAGDVRVGDSIRKLAAHVR
jgi:hypothetical protein